MQAMVRRGTSGAAKFNIILRQDDNLWGLTRTRESVPVKIKSV